MFYANIWDPLLIVSQIVLLQSLFYVCVGSWLLLFSLTFGWPASGAFLCVAPMMGYALLHVIGRAKQCLDFVATLYFIHFGLCGWYSGSFPTNWEWWLINIIGCIVCVIIGEYLCLQKELEAIPMTSEERELRERERERRSERQHALNQAALASSASAAGLQERTSLVKEEKELRGERAVTTTTIRLTPNNVFNV